MKKRLIKVLICLIIVLAGVATALNCGGISVKTYSGKPQNVLFIDAGHGGIDGGAVSNNGVPEKDINLAIAVKVRNLADEYGFRPVMTRETDEELYSSEEGSIRARKTEDLRERCDMLKKYDPAVAVSIHLNSFKEDPSVKGAQVFYPSGWSDTELQKASESLAETMQKNISGAVHMEKERTPLAKEDVFLFKEEVCPIVIIECGFLSNPEEAELLQDDAYQQKLAEGIMAGIAEFTGVERIEKIRVIDSYTKKNKH